MARYIFVARWKMCEGKTLVDFDLKQGAFGVLCSAYLQVLI